MKISRELLKALKKPYLIIDSTHFVVFVEGAQGPKKKHETLESAKEEAKRLAENNLGRTVSVYPSPIVSYRGKTVVEVVEV